MAKTPTNLFYVIARDGYMDNGFLTWGPYKTMAEAKQEAASKPEVNRIFTIVELTPEGRVNGYDFCTVPSEIRLPWEFE